MQNVVSKTYFILMNIIQIEEMALVFGCLRFGLLLISQYNS